MSSKKAFFAVVFALFVTSMACTNPITSYFSTQTAVMETATATMWTPTPTTTPTSTPTKTPTNTPTNTSTPTPDPRFYETGAEIKFSYVPPAGWTKDTDTNGLSLWKGAGNTLLSFSVYQLSSDAATYGVLLENQMKSQFTGYKLIDKGAFSPDSGLDAYRFAITAEFTGVTVRIETYTFSGNGYIINGGYIRSEGSDEDQDALVKESMMTMRFD